VALEQCWVSLQRNDWIIDAMYYAWRNASSMSGDCKLVEILADRIRDYEHRVHPWPDTSTPASVLANPMEERGLRQSELQQVQVLASRLAIL
jgi:hypothetical protein